MTPRHTLLPPARLSVGTPRTSSPRQFGCIWAFAAVVALVLFSLPALAQTENVLYSFSGASDGSYPWAPLVFDRQGNLYGTATCGGTGVSCLGDGVVFELSPNGSGGWNQSVLHTFQGPDGSTPYSNLLLDASGNIYGTTAFGGANGFGVVFKLSRRHGAWTESVLYSFCSQTNCTDGNSPQGSLLMDGSGNLIGTTTNDVFELTPVNGGWTEQNIYSIHSGSFPGLTMDSSGNIFGVDLNNAFELTPNGSGGWTPTVLHVFTPHTFCGPDVTCPPDPVGSPLLDKAGNIYGVTLLGGTTGCGQIYRLKHVNGKWNKSTLYKFTGANGDGCSVFGGLVSDSAGNIYGTTIAGGTFGSPRGDGTIFELIPTGKTKYTKKTVWNFSQSDGAWPTGGLIWDNSGTLYGAAYQGGSANRGAVFNFTP